MRILKLIKLFANFFKKLLSYYSISTNSYSIFRQHDVSFAKGIVSATAHDYDNSRRMISMKISFVGWLLELLGTVITLLTPILHNMGLANLYYPDAIIMFVLIPFIHIVNEDKTKGIIAENGWYEGLLYIFGMKI